MSSVTSGYTCIPLYVAGILLAVEQVVISHQTELQSWLNKFDQFLPRPGDGGGCSEGQDPTRTECEALWEVIKEDDVMVTSLKHIHSALLRWWNGNQTTGSNVFNPQGEHGNAPTMEMIDNIDWKSMIIFTNRPEQLALSFFFFLVLLGGVIGGMTTHTICSVLETNRWEFQDGASGSLEEREAELIKTIRTHLHYNDDCTV